MDYFRSVRDVPGFDNRAWGYPSIGEHHRSSKTRTYFDGWIVSTTSGGVTGAAFNAVTANWLAKTVDQVEQVVAELELVTKGGQLMSDAVERLHLLGYDGWAVRH